jgi:nitrite reductase/ring-hydroxylating ferredoxin subunit
MSQGERVRAGHITEFPFGRKKLIKTDLENILVVNVGGEFFAVSNTCPHAGGYLNYGSLDGYIIECPLHYWPFDLRTGCLVGMEELGEDEYLNTYPVLVEGDEIYIQLPPRV